MTRERVLVSRRRLLRSAAAGAVTLTAPSIVRAESDPLKVGVLLPRSGYEASIGQDCQRGVEIAPGILKSLGLPTIAIMNADTESSVDTARARAEKLIGEGAQLLVGAFDSGQTTAVAQVAEQKGVPLVINIAASPAITEQGYRFVFRNFPTAPMILNDAFAKPGGDLCHRRRSAEDGRLHACERHVRHGHVEGHRRDHAEIQNAVHDC